MLLCLKTHPCRWKVLSSKIKVDSLLNGHIRPSPLSLVSRLRPTSPPVIRSLACASWRKTATGDWQPTTGFMAVVSGGRQVSRMDDCQRDFTLPSCALTHTVLPPACSHWLISTAVCPCSSGGAAANTEGGNSAFKYYVNTIQNAEGYEFLLIWSHFWKLQVTKHALTTTHINAQPLNQLSPHKKGLVVFCFAWEFYLHLTDLLLCKDIDLFLLFFFFADLSLQSVCTHCPFEILKKMNKNYSKHLTNLNETDERTSVFCFFFSHKDW